MTICIAGIVEDKKIIAVTDKMITLGAPVVTRYEVSENNKAISLNKKTIGMFAGSVLDANEILVKAKAKITDTQSVKEVADSVNEAYREHYEAICTNWLMSKYTIDLTQFMHNHSSFDAEFVRKTTQTLMDFKLDVGILVAGVDTAPAIYSVDAGGTNYCHNPIGYASIGSGSQHATLSLVESKYSSKIVLEEGLFALLNAKKRAEFDPGVGKLCDIVIINTKVDKFDDTRVERMLKQQDKAQQSIDRTKIKSIKEIKKII